MNVIDTNAMRNRISTLRPRLNLDSDEWARALLAYCGEIDSLRLALAAAREDASERTWERDHAIANYHRVRDELAAFRLQHYAGGDRG